MTIENTHFQEIEVEELSIDEAFTIFGADPEFHLALDKFQGVDADHSTPIDHILELDELS